MKKERYEELTKKILSGNATAEEKKLLNETKAMKSLMRQQWDKTGCDGNADAQTGKRIWKQIAESCGFEKKHPHISLLQMGCAAGVAILLSIGILWMNKNNDGKHRKEYREVIAREVQLLSLPDQSRIWMQPGTTVRYAPQSFDTEREVWLQGDATFEVASREKRPFRVHFGQAFIEVKGTAFRIDSRNKEESKVMLYNGKVDFHAQATNRTIRMEPHQCLTYQSNGDLRLDRIDHIDWQNGIYKFSDMRLDSLISTVRSMYTIDIEIAPDVACSSRFNGAIRYDERPSEIAEKICFVMNLKYKQENNKLIIYKSREKRKSKSN